ncbi:MAG: AraC family transcriptional regulator ligand-binding domain-containing protein, partial [Proteobacteria bacterium]|nr:AraC family transcriptional regulator ligand-binding domain-containing protein [Pseudomonadota bacterium]
MHTPLRALPVPALYARLLLEHQPRRAAVLLRGTGLTAAELAARESISAEQQLAILGHALRVVGGDDWAVRFGAELGINSHGPLGFAAISAATLGEGLGLLAEYGPIRAPYLGFALVPAARELRLVVDTGRYPLGPLAAPVVDVVLEVARAYVTAVCGTRPVRLTYYLARPRPARAPRGRRGARLVWGAPFDGLGVPAALRDF